MSLIERVPLGEGAQGEVTPDDVATLGYAVAPLKAPARFRCRTRPSNAGAKAGRGKDVQLAQ